MRQAVMAEPERFGFDGGIQESSSITRQDFTGRYSDTFEQCFAWCV